MRKTKRLTAFVGVHTKRSPDELAARLSQRATTVPTGKAKQFNQSRQRQRAQALADQ